MNIINMQRCKQQQHTEMYGLPLQNSAGFCLAL